MNNNTKDEYLHQPMDRRLWNESYYWDFASESISGFTRLGYQPYERRANVWFYLVSDGRIYGFRSERIPLEDVFGHHVCTDAFESSYRICEPYQEWELSFETTARVYETTRSVFDGEPDHRTDIDLDLTFTDPHHDPHAIDMLVDTQSHYSQAGRFVGEATIGGESVPIDGSGFRDHSWGWFRDWTPGEWGHCAGLIQFESGRCYQLVAVITPDGEVKRAYGYRADEGTMTPVEETELRYSDDIHHTERGRAWAEGNYPDEITFTPTFDGEETEIVCRPTASVPIGYEDRNWELTDPDGPWLTGVINRMAITCREGDTDGSGWLEATHPL